MKRTVKTYSEEFRLEALRLLEASGKSVRENAILRQERDILKKALSIFSKEQR